MTTVLAQLPVRRRRAAIERAVAPGATIMRPASIEHGWRLRRIEAPFSHH
jgi:hypothetical protein